MLNVEFLHGKLFLAAIRSHMLSMAFLQQAELCRNEGCIVRIHLYCLKKKFSQRRVSPDALLFSQIWTRLCFTNSISLLTWMSFRLKECVQVVALNGRMHPSQMPSRKRMSQVGPVKDSHHLRQLPRERGSEVAKPKTERMVVQVLLKLLYLFLLISEE